MKKISNLLLFTLSLFAFASCDKVDDLPLYGKGNAVALTASSPTIAPAPADSNNVVLTYTWTYPNYSTDSANIKYIIEIDSVGKNFAAPYSKEVMGKTSGTFIAKELNGFLVARGYAFNVPVSLEARVISSYANNNERLISNVLPLRVTPYKIPPRVALPTTGKLYIVGGATQGGWGSNPVPVPTQEFARLNETTWGGIFQLNGGEQYLMLPLNGSWDNKFAVANSSLAGLSGGGDFGFNLSDNFPAPGASGMYQIIVDFQTGKFKVTPFAGTLPSNLYMVGGATPGGWGNPVPVPSQQLTRLNSSQWELSSIALTAGEKYLFLPVNGSWAAKYGVTNAGAAGIANGGAITLDGQDIPAPAVTGNYKILVNFATVETNPGFPTGKFSAIKL